MATAAGSLEKACNAFGGTNLDDSFDGAKVNTKVKACCAYYCFQLACMQCFFYPDAQFLFNASMVQCKCAGKIRSEREQFLIPQFTHASRIDEDERGLAFFENR